MCLIPKLTTNVDYNFYIQSVRFCVTAKANRVVNCKLKLHNINYRGMLQPVTLSITQKRQLSLQLTSP